MRWINLPKGLDGIKQLGLYSFVFLSVAGSIFPIGLETKHFGIALTESPEKMATVFGQSDAGSYLSTALELVKLNGLTENKSWVLNLWPPGMPTLEAFLLKLGGSAFATFYCLLVTIIWSFLISVVSRKIARHYGYLAAGLGAAIILTGTPLQVWIFGDGIFYAEGVSMAAFVAALVCLIKAAEPISTSAEKTGWGILTGTFLALSAYFRSTFSTIEIALGVALVISLLVTFSPRLTSKIGLTRSVMMSHTRTTGAIFAVMFALMEPWFEFTMFVTRQGTRSWSLVSGIFVRGAWQERDTSAGFLKSGGVGWACELDKSFCESVQQFESATGTLYPIQDLARHMIATVLTHPLSYIQDRMYFISTGWFSFENSMGTLAIASGLITLFGFILVLTLSTRAALNGHLLMALIPLFSLMIFIPALIGHIEPRYFMPLKLSILCLPWLLTGAFKKTVRIPIL